MRELVFLLEEGSASALLKSLLPRVLRPETGFRLVSFEGKQDLERKLMQRIRAYQNPMARFIVLRDQDSHPNCRELKDRLLALCSVSNKREQCLVRIACTELESFYLADLVAVERALGLSKLAIQQQRQKFRSPDQLGNPSRELSNLTKGQYQKVAGSRAIGQFLDVENSRSPSFRNLIAGIRRLESELHSMATALPRSPVDDLPREI